VLAYHNPDVEEPEWFRSLANLKGTRIEGDEDGSKALELAHLFSEGELYYTGEFDEHYPEQYCALNGGVEDAAKIVDEKWNSIGPPIPGFNHFGALVAKGQRGGLPWGEPAPDPDLKASERFPDAGRHDRAEDFEEPKPNPAGPNNDFGYPMYETWDFSKQKPAQAIVDTLLYDQSFHMLFGAFGSVKTYLTLDICGGKERLENEIGRIKNYTWDKTRKARDGTVKTRLSLLSDLLELDRRSKPIRPLRFLTANLPPEPNEDWE